MTDLELSLCFLLMILVPCVVAVRSAGAEEVDTLPELPGTKGDPQRRISPPVPLLTKTEMIAIRHREMHLRDMR